MKTIFRIAALGMLLSAFVVLCPATGFAQDACDDADAIAAADARVRTNYPKIETKKIAVEAGKDYIQKYSKCEDSKTFVEWLTPLIPVWEKQIKDNDDLVWWKARVAKFDGGIKTAKFDDSYAAGDEILSKYPDNMNIILPLGLIGLYETYKNNHKYNEDTIRYAKMAIDKFKAGGLVSKKDKDGKPILDKAGKEVYGPFQFERNKDDALSELTYAIAHINYYAKKDRKAALPYYYEVAQMPGIYKDEPRLFITLGSFYTEESAPLGRELVALIEKQKAATTDAEKEKLDADFKAKEGLYNGYIERALDAFARAYRAADETIASEKTLKDDVYKKLRALYGPRVETKEALEAHIKSSIEKPLPNPADEVTPVFDPEPVTTATVGANTTAVNTDTVTAAPSMAVTRDAKAAAAPAKRAATKGKASKPSKRAVKKP